MVSVQGLPALGVLSEVVLLGALDLVVGVSGLGWAVGLACAIVVNAALARGRYRTGAVGLGAADRVTLTRATLACSVAALTADAFVGPIPVAALVALSVVALALDAVDGWVARWTGTASALGARFDGEVDAFLILVLSAYVARLAGGWVWSIGGARYAFLAAGWFAPWLTAPLPARYWRKVVAAAQGIVLTCAAAQFLPSGVTITALIAALALLSESFGRDVWWLWRRRAAHTGRAVTPRLPKPAPFADADPTAART